MGSIRPGDIQRFLNSGCRNTPLVLVFGPDEGSVRTRVKAIADTLLGADYDPMSRVELDPDSLNADPGRLTDEANAINMFGGKRVIIVQQAGRLQKTVWLPVLEAPPLDSTILFQADDLTKSSPLRVAIEQSATGAAIACYAPSRHDIQELIDTRMNAAQLSITPAARAYLADLLGADLALSENEINKLALYCQGQLAVDVADIDVMIADSSELSSSEPIDRAFEGKLEGVEAVALRSFREGINPSGLLAMALNHSILLRKLILARQSGSLDSALRSERIFFRRLDRVRNQATGWDLPGIGRAIETLAAAQDQARRTASLEETIAIRALWSIALASRRR